MLTLTMNFMTIYNKKRNLCSDCRTKITFKKYSVKNLLFITVPVIMLLAACEEDPAVIGGDLLPVSDFYSIESVDTVGVYSYTGYNNDIRSFYTDTVGEIIQPTNAYLGSDYSPYFGTTQAGFVTQLWLLQEWPGNHATFDSLMLTLDISSHSGSTPIEEFINIYEIEEKLSTDSVYYVSDDMTEKNFLGSFSLAGIDNDTVVTVRLPGTFINELMRDTSKIYLTEEGDAFRDYFRGIKVEYPQSENHHMFKINLNGGYSYMTLYYTDTAAVSRSFVFLFNTKTVNFNTFSHDFESAEPDKKIKYINQRIEDTVSYIQGYNGVFNILAMPGLESLKDSMPVSINKARLYLPAYTNETDFLEEVIPEQLIARYLTDDGDRYIINDYLVDPVFMDGQYYSLDDYYILNITNFVKEYLEGSISNPEIEIIMSSFEGSHLILYTGKSINPPRLEIVYTKH